LEGYTNDPTRVNYKIIPMFNGGATPGSTYTIAGSLFGRTDSNNTYYADVTHDAQAPAVWKWNDVVNLDAKLFGSNGSTTPVTADVDQIRVRVTVDSYPDNAKNLNQFKSDKVTPIANNSYQNKNNIVLQAQATDPDSSESLSIYYQYIPTAQSSPPPQLVRPRLASAAVIITPAIQKFGWLLMPERPKISVSRPIPELLQSLIFLTALINGRLLSAMPVISVRLGSYSTLPLPI